MEYVWDSDEGIGGARDFGVGIERGAMEGIWRMCAGDCVLESQGFEGVVPTNQKGVAHCRS